MLALIRGVPLVKEIGGEVKRLRQHNRLFSFLLSGTSSTFALIVLLRLRQFHHKGIRRCRAQIDLVRFRCNGHGGSIPAADRQQLCCNLLRIVSFFENDGLDGVAPFCGGQDNFSVLVFDCSNVLRSLNDNGCTGVIEAFCNRQFDKPFEQVNVRLLAGVVGGAFHMFQRGKSVTGFHQRLDTGQPRFFTGVIQIFFGNRFVAAVVLRVGTNIVRFLRVQLCIA